MNRLPTHNPYIGSFHHGQKLFKTDHPTYLYKHRHNPSMPMMAHSPPVYSGLFREIVPIRTVLPLFIYMKNTEESEWVMVESPESLNKPGRMQ